MSIVKLKYTTIITLEVPRSSYPEGTTDEKILELERENAVDVVVDSLAQSNNDTISMKVEIVP